MGKSAKVHKRIPKKLKTSSSSTTNPGPVSTPSSSRIEAAQSAKKRSKLKDKASAKTLTTVPASAVPGPGKTSKVLGGADYVSLLMGGRRKARKEALKLPQSST